MHRKQRAKSEGQGGKAREAKTRDVAAKVGEAERRRSGPEVLAGGVNCHCIAQTTRYTILHREEDIVSYGVCVCLCVCLCLCVCMCLCVCV